MIKDNYANCPPIMTMIWGKDVLRGQVIIYLQNWLLTSSKMQNNIDVNSIEGPSCKE